MMSTSAGPARFAQGPAKNAYHQISYTRKGRSRSEYVRPENLTAVCREIAAFRRSNFLVDRLLDLSRLSGSAEAPVAPIA